MGRGTEVYTPFGVHPASWAARVIFSSIIFFHLLQLHWSEKAVDAFAWGWLVLFPHRLQHLRTALVAFATSSK